MKRTNKIYSVVSAFALGALLWYPASEARIDVPLSSLIKISSPAQVCEAPMANLGVEVVEYGGIKFEVSKVELKEFYQLAPHPIQGRILEPTSPIAQDLDTKWDLNRFKSARSPLRIAKVEADHEFSKHSDLRILDMPIKMAGSNEYRIPAELKQFLPTIQEIIDNEHSILSEEQLLKYHAYITIDQGWVSPGKTQRKPGAHVDGFQGARIEVKNTVNHSYIASDDVPTVFYPQSFDFSHLDESKHDFFLEMDRLSDEVHAVKTKPYEIYLMDAYTVHRADLAAKPVYRTFFRISYDVKEFDRLGNTHNPHFDYHWDMQIRDVHSTLMEYRPLEQCRSCGACARGRALQGSRP